MVQQRIRPLIFALFFFAAFGGVIYLQQSRPQAPLANQVTFAFNEGKPILTPGVGRLVSFGYPRALSSLLWLRFLQYTPSEHVPTGERSWIYYDFLTISRLDPDFLPVYTMGALYLSVINEDHRGAEEILRRGEELHPHNIKILANLAYHYQYEVNDRARAAEYFAKAAREPGAPAIYSIMASNYLRKSESNDAAITYLSEMAARTGDDKVKEKIAQKIELLRKEGRP